MPAFSIGRIGCTVVHDHIGRATSSVFGIDYPRSELVARGVYDELGGHGTIIRAHNLAMYELAYLIPVNIFILWLAFQKKKRLPAGFVAVMIGLLYAPVRFVIEFWGGVLLQIAGVIAMPLGIEGAILVLAGLLIYEKGYVGAGQSVPLA